MCQDHLGSQGDQLFRENLRLSAGRRKAICDVDIAFFQPSTLLEPLPECREAGPRCLIVLGEAHQYADPPHSVGLLRPRRERPRGSRAAQCGKQFPPSDGDCHTPLPCEVRKGNDITPRARSLAVQGGASTSVFGFNCTTPAASLLANAAIAALRVAA